MLLNRVRTYLKFGFSAKQVANRIKYSISRKGAILKYRPLWLLIFVSDLCNLECKMCPHHTRGNASNFKFLKKEKGMMRPGIFETIMKKFPEATLVMFAGVGEPLLNPHFLSLAKIAAENKKIINLVTNGVFLDRKKMDMIIELERFNQISISLNASTSQDYKNICGMPKEIFDKVVNNIKKLVYLKKHHKSKAKFEIIVSAVCSKEFIPKIKDFLIFADTLGVDRIDIHNYIDFSIKEKNNQWTSIETTKKNISILSNIEKFSQEKINAKVNLPIILKPDNFDKKCDWFFKNLCFDAYGNIGGCGRIINPSRNYGNLLTDNDDVWNNEYMKTMREKSLNSNERLLECCNKCIENY